MGKQIAGAAAGVAFSALGTALIVVVLGLVMKLRIPEEHERSGIDQHTHGAAPPATRDMFSVLCPWDWGHTGDGKGRAPKLRAIALHNENHDEATLSNSQWILTI